MPLVPSCRICGSPDLVETAKDWSAACSKPAESASAVGGIVNEPLPIIGRERALVNLFARELYKSTFHPKTDRVDTRRGVRWDVHITEGGHKRVATDRIARVTVEFLRVGEFEQVNP